MTEEHDPEELRALGRSIVDRNLYMVLATSDSAGHAWATPVYFAPEEYRSFLWVSRPETRHSRNIAERAELAITNFDSSAAIGTGRAVYMTASGRELAGDERAAAVEHFSHRSTSHGGHPWGVADLERQVGVRMYRATAGEQYVNDEFDRRVAVNLWEG